MDSGTANLIASAKLIYQPVLVGRECRIRHGKRLWQQFDESVQAFANGRAKSRRSIQERINEMATAKAIIDDQSVVGEVTYEPDVLLSGRAIDFVVARPEDNLYVEVKTVHPDAADNDDSGEKHEKRRRLHPENAEYRVAKDWRGGEIYGNSLAARAKFLDYALAFEDRLAEAQSVRPGPGVLVFCGNGFKWHISELEDFADFYLLGRHRGDDPFSRMETDTINRKGLRLKRNISSFTYLERDQTAATVMRLKCNVQGPAFG